MLNSRCFAYQAEPAYQSMDSERQKVIDAAYDLLPKIVAAGRASVYRNDSFPLEYKVQARGVNIIFVLSGDNPIIVDLTSHQ